MLKSLWRVPNQQIIFSLLEPLNFKVVTDVGFGGESTATFDQHRYFRAHLRGEVPFCAISCTLPTEFRNINAFDAVSIRCKTMDKRPFSFSVKSNSFFPGARYQGYIVPKQPGVFCDYVFPFSHLLQTFRGKTAKNQSKLDYGHELNRIYFLVGGQFALPGAFEVEIDEIKWLKLNVHPEGYSHDFQRFLERKGLLQV